MSTRRITALSRRYTRQVKDALMSLFALELVTPSSELYLISAWITDIEILDNTFGQYRVLLPEAVGTQVRLSALLNILSERGCQVYVALRHDRTNSDFISRLNKPSIHLKTSVDLHAKMLVSRHFCWDGSMNFTYSGVNKNPETITLSTDLAYINKGLIDMKQLWEALS